ncbi:hypothetical protein BDQ17DRAFT_1413816 [Cyathus striatus]|nr:hypothetical protein BDQ17DRAFT_1413816 [Cyathus striatus]
MTSFILICARLGGILKVRFCLAHRDHQIAEKIVSLCELDPKSTTCEDMGIRFFSIYHSLPEHHLNDLSLAFILIDDNDVVKDVKFLLEQVRLSWIRAGESLEMKHGIAKATHDDDVVDMDIEPRITCNYQYDELL